MARASHARPSQGSGNAVAFRPNPACAAGLIVTSDRGARRHGQNLSARLRVKEDLTLVLLGRIPVDLAINKAHLLAGQVRPEAATADQGELEMVADLAPWKFAIGIKQRGLLGSLAMAGRWSQTPNWVAGVSCQRQSIRGHEPNLTASRPVVEAKYGVIEGQAVAALRLQRQSPSHRRLRGGAAGIAMESVVGPSPKSSPGGP